MKNGWRKRSYNRLLERGNRTTAATFKMDDRAKAVTETLLRSGYSNIGEMFIDLLYKEANRLNSTLCLPEVSEIPDRKDELVQQLEELKKAVQKRMVVA